MYFLIFAYWYVFPLKIIYSITRYVGGKYFVFVKTNARYVGGATKRVQNTKKVQPDLTLTSYSIKKKNTLSTGRYILGVCYAGVATFLEVLMSVSCVGRLTKI